MGRELRQGMMGGDGAGQDGSTLDDATPELRYDKYPVKRWNNDIPLNN